MCPLLSFYKDVDKRLTFSLKLPVQLIDAFIKEYRHLECISRIADEIHKSENLIRAVAVRMHDMSQVTETFLAVGVISWFSFF